MSNEVILIVEDNDMLREGLREMLMIEGFNVAVARHGKEALGFMDSLTPSLIISDISMPVMDGFDFFSAVRARIEWVTIPFLFLTARAEPSDILTGKILGADDYLTKPINRDELVGTIRSRLTRARQVEVWQLQQAYLDSLTIMANAIEVRDPFSYGHVQRVADCALILAENLGWQPRQKELLRFGAILHDVGKIIVPETILLKQEKLSDEEWKEIHRHPLVGAEMIRGIPYLAAVTPTIHSHHEHWDGTGYPDGLSENAIPQSARIVAVSDAFDAMTTHRPYGRVRSQQEAFEELVSLSGSFYDPQVVDAFQDAWKAGRIQVIGNRKKS